MLALKKTDPYIMRKLLALTLIALVAFSSTAFSQSPPSTDIYVFDLKEAKRRVKLSNGKNMTDRDGYDNQPFFYATDLIMYSSHVDGQNDIFMLDLTTGEKTNLTNTPESEYSPHLITRTNSFAAVRVEADGAQRLWQFDVDRKQAPNLIFDDLAPVGYHAWAGTDVAMFILGDPVTLLLTNAKERKDQILTSNIERTIKAAGRAFIIQKNEESGNNIYSVSGGRSVRLRKITTLPKGATDWTLTPSGSYITSVGSKVFKINPQFDSAWSEIADLSDMGIQNITRIAVSGDNSKIALVADR